MMDLHCVEVPEHEVKASIDKNLLTSRVLLNMLYTEETLFTEYGIRSPFFLRRHGDIKEYMVTIVSEWMMEVCEEQKCQDEVFPLSMNYLFRCLILQDFAIKKNQLQLLGATCMLIASKLREPRPLNVETLVFYTDYSITKDMLTNWELVVLSKLKWDIVTIVPFDFLPHVLLKLPLEEVGVCYEMVKNHAKILITLCAKECRLVHRQPSIIACACIVSALCGLGWVTRYQQSLERLLDRLQFLCNVDQDIVREIVNDIDTMIKVNTDNVKDNTEKVDEVPRPEQFTPPPDKMYEHKTATTPTDVHDILF